MSKFWEKEKKSLISGEKMLQGSFHTTQRIFFSIKDFSSKCDQIHSFRRIWSYLLKKSLKENFNFYVVSVVSRTKIQRLI